MKKTCISLCIALAGTAAIPSLAASVVIGDPNVIAIRMFELFVCAILGIMYWAARHTRTAKDFYAAGGSIMSATSPVMVRRTRVVLAALAAVVPGMAFASDSDPHHGHPSSPGTLEPHVVSKGGSFKLQLQSLPDPIPLNEIFELIVTVDPSAVADASTNPVWLRAQAEMPSHKHGMNTRAIVEPLEDNKFIIKGLLFHMSGEWLITFDLAKGRVHEQAETRVGL